MNSPGAISVFVKLEYWDAYASLVYLTATRFKKALYIFGAMAALFAGLFLFAWLRPRPDSEWFQTLQSSKANLWIFALPAAVVFVVPLLSAQKLVENEITKSGFTYIFSEDGVHVESSVSRSDFSWVVAQEAIETGRRFLIFTKNGSVQNLPKRSFTGDDVVRFRALLRDHVSKVSLRL